MKKTFWASAVIALLAFSHFSAYDYGATKTYSDTATAAIDAVSQADTDRTAMATTEAANEAGALGNAMKRDTELDELKTLVAGYEAKLQTLRTPNCNLSPDTVKRMQQFGASGQITSLDSYWGGHVVLAPPVDDSACDRLPERDGRPLFHERRPFLGFSMLTHQRGPGSPAPAKRKPIPL